MNKAQIVANELSKINISKLRAELLAKNNLIFARENPQFLKLDQDLRKFKLELSKQSDSKIITSIHTKIKKLEQQQDKILATLKLSRADLMPKYSCTICQDTGYIDGHMCSCLSNLVQNALARQSGMSSVLKYSFDTSDPKIVSSSPSLKKAYTIAKNYVEGFPDYKFKNLIFLGNVGAGKTYLIECICNALLDKGFNVVFSTAYDLNETMQNSFWSNSLERQAILAPYFESDLLVIDDLGSEPILRNITVNNLFTVLNKRESLSLPTIISTNLNPEEIQERYGDRILSRIFNRRTTLAIPFDEKDLRLNSK